MFNVKETELIYIAIYFSFSISSLINSEKIMYAADNVNHLLLNNEILHHLILYGLLIKNYT